MQNFENTFKRPNSHLGDSKDYQTIQEASNEEIQYTCKSFVINIQLLSYLLHWMKRKWKRKFQLKWKI